MIVMENIRLEDIENLQVLLEESLDDSNISELHEKIIRMRFGLGIEEPLSFNEMMKVFKLPPKKMKNEIENAERKAFNMLKHKL